MDSDLDQPNRAEGRGERPSYWPALREGLSRTGGGLVALARLWGPRAATGVQQAAIRARESQVAGRTVQAAGRAGRALQERSRVVKAQVSTWTWPRRALGEVARRYPMLDRAWKQFLHSFSLADRPAESPPTPLRAVTRPQAPRRTQPASTVGRPRNNLRKAA